MPNKGVVYNDEKAKKNEQESKQKTLLRLEENRKKQRSKTIICKDYIFLWVIKVILYQGPGRLRVLRTILTVEFLTLRSSGQKSLFMFESVKAIFLI